MIIFYTITLDVTQFVFREILAISFLIVRTVTALGNQWWGAYADLPLVRRLSKLRLWMWAMSEEIGYIRSSLFSSLPSTPSTTWWPPLTWTRHADFFLWWLFTDLGSLSSYIRTQRLAHCNISKSYVITVTTCVNSYKVSSRRINNCCSANQKLRFNEKESMHHLLYNMYLKYAINTSSWAISRQYQVTCKNWHDKTFSFVILLA